MFSGTPTWPVMPGEHLVLVAQVAEVHRRRLQEAEGRLVRWLRSSVVQTDTSCDGSSTGSGFSSTALTSVKIVVFAPMPSASDSAAIAVNAGVFGEQARPELQVVEKCRHGLILDDQPICGVRSNFAPGVS